MYESLTELAESELRELLIKLFKRMGFQDVEHYHWGPLEQGKDIVMWKLDDAHVRRNWGVVVKAGRVQSAGAEAIFNQIRQCLNDPFVDLVTYGKQPVHHCYVVAPEFTKEARNSLNNLLSPEERRSITYLCGSRLESLFREHLGERAITSDLSEIGRRLAALDSEWDVISTVESDKVHYELRPKPSADPPRPLTFQLEFRSPDSPEGREVQELIEVHQKTGAPVKIEGSLIKSLELPDFLANLFASADDVSYGIELSRETRLKRVTCEFLFDPRGAEETLSLQPVVLEVVQAGTHEITLTNAMQNVPWSVQLVVGLADGGYGKFRLEATLTGASVSRASGLVAFSRALAVGGRITVRSTDHDCQLVQFEVPQVPTDPPFDSYTQEFCDAAKSIQDATGTLLVIPDRDLTAEEHELVFRVARLIREGREKVTGGTVPMDLKGVGLEKAVEAFGGTEPTMLYVRQNVSAVVLGTKVDLGSRRITWSQPPLEDARIQELREAQHSLAEGEVFRFEVSLENVDAVAVYEDWLD